MIHVHNDFREAPLCDLREVELNLLWTLLYELKDKGLEDLMAHGRADISIPIENIIESSNYNKTRKFVEKDFEIIADIITSYKIPITDGEYKGKVVPFPIVKTDKNKTNLTVTVLVEFAYIVNYIFAQANFTKLSLVEMNGLNGKPAKIAYYHMSTYSDTGVWHMDKNSLYKIFGIPKSYTPRDIRRRIIAPIIQECGKHFGEIKYYEREGQKHSIEAVMFVFEPRNVKDFIRSDVKRNSQLEQLKENWIDKTATVKGEES